MPSRLDRLVILLDTGSTQLIRFTAAQQLADIQKQHPNELFNLLSRVIPYLRSKKWDTRIAAAKAVGGIAENFRSSDSLIKPDPDDDNVPIKHDPSSLDQPVKLESDDLNIPPSCIPDDQLDLDTIDFMSILQKGKPLLGSAGREYDCKLAAMDPAVRLAHQKKTLISRLGLGGEYIDEDLVTESDLVSHALGSDSTTSRKKSLGPDSPASKDCATPPTPNEESGLSKRQLNMLKRKNKQAYRSQTNKIRVIELTSSRSGSIQSHTSPSNVQSLGVKSEPTETSSPNDVNPINEYYSLDRPNGDDDTRLVKEFKGLATEPKSVYQDAIEENNLSWPFERLCELLSVDLFDPNWEVRHGAAMGLREIIRTHGAGAGRYICLTNAQNDHLNRAWLIDLACRLCAVFVLDRFGDYISDNVVVPVRETAGQCLGAVLQYLPAHDVKRVYLALRRLIYPEDGSINDISSFSLASKMPDRPGCSWQPFHGCMLGLRYLVAVRSDILVADPDFLDGMLCTVMAGLRDEDDDVRAVSAATLIPVAKDIVTLRTSLLNGLLVVLWDCLSNLSDDLRASMGSIMNFLARLCSFDSVLEAMKKNAVEYPEQSFDRLVPRLFPFLRHTITSVRSAVLSALLTFLDMQDEASKGWVDGKALRLIFQNIVVERNESVLQLSLQVWQKLLNVATSQKHDATIFASEFSYHVDPLLALTLNPIGVNRHPIPMNPSFFLRPSGQTFNGQTQVPFHLQGHTCVGEACNCPLMSNKSAATTANHPEPIKKRRKSKKFDDLDISPSVTHNVDAPMIAGDIDLVTYEVMLRSKILSSVALGQAIAAWPLEQRAAFFVPRLLPYFSSASSSVKLTACILAEEYALCLAKQAETKSADQSDGNKLHPDPINDELLLALLPVLQTFIEEDLPSSYADLTSYLHVARAQCQSLMNAFRDVARVSPSLLTKIAPVVQGDENASQFAFSIDVAKKVVFQDYEKLKTSMSPAQRVASLSFVENVRADAERAVNDAIMFKETRDLRIRAAAAAVFASSMSTVAKKPASAIKCLMDSVKKEENWELQSRSAKAVARLVVLISASGKRVVVEKIVGNLLKFACMETAETPEFEPNMNIKNGILSLRKEENVRDHVSSTVFKQDAKAAKITRRGAKEALEQLVVLLGEDVFEKLPVLQRLIETPIIQVFGQETMPDSVYDPASNLGQNFIDGLSTLRALVGKFHPKIHGFVLKLLPMIARALHCELAVLRYTAAKCFATICSLLTVPGITLLVEQILPGLSNSSKVHYRQGAIECVYHLINVMSDGILPYVVFLIVPVLGRMSDLDSDVRLITTTAFATLVKLVPLEAGIPDPPGMNVELLKGRERERKFLTQMLDLKKIEEFEIPVAINAKLRSYQREGVNWLAFLNRYHLHGILCDDMGLGKTLQVLCMVASDHYNRAQEFAKTGSMDHRRLPSLVVCLPTLSGHWQQEIRTFAPFLTFVSYCGSQAERLKVRWQLEKVDIVITSYDICRNDIDVIRGINWNYCVLDEGHVIKNPRAKTTLAVKQLMSNYRLIMSGTPIQNNVLELWSLFDFLMPGFLGTEKVFHDRFVKPIAQSRFSKSSSKEQEAGALAIEALHKQVLPFLLRRLKEEVLDDLPPKIIQNYYCDLSELQRRLFEDFIKKEGASIAEKANSSEKEAKQHVFQALQYMRKLCNSPAFVMKEGHRAYESTVEYLHRNGTNISDAIHAPKLLALRDLLVDCGIGSNDSGGVGNGGGSGSDGELLISGSDAVSQHRALIFCQMKEMLDMVEKVVLKKLLPTVTFMRLDGSVEATRRQDIVNKFNGDPSYDVLLLTTSVGGLGLNLTGADTVIFVEHDWNPQKDMQAMDRAHRIGQKKVVNVYRIVTRGTLEEKILNLQRFKIDVASTVVNQQNSSMNTMDTNQILDLFNLSTGEGEGMLGENERGSGKEGVGKVEGISENDAVDATGEVRRDGKKNILDELGELWDERQYQNEFDIDAFIASMKG